jgi:PAS domain S-box-containing protein
MATSDAMHQQTRSLSSPRSIPAHASRARAEFAAVPTNFYRDMVRGMRNGTVAITREGRVAVFNEEAYRILGLSPQPDDIGRHFSQVLGPRSEIVRLFANAFDVAHLPSRAEMRLKDSGRVIGYTLSIVRGERGSANGAALFFKDLTRVEQLEERERLRDRLAALGEMAAAIAHEVKNPLAGIEVMAGLLKRRVPDDPDTQSLLHDIIQEAKMANAIVIEVLEFVRPIRLQVDHVSLAEVIDDSIRMAESLVPRGTVRVDRLLPTDLPRLEADGHQLRQLFTNLATNAFEALNGHGRLSIRAWESADEDRPGDSPSIVVELKDDGPGIPEEVRDRVFSPFFTTKPRGSGLGLAIVRKIVDAHEGRIDLSVEPTGGTTFRLVLPTRPSDHEEATGA